MQIGERIVIDGQDYWLEGILSTGVGSYGQVWAATSAGGLAVALKFINTDAMLQADPSLHGHWRAHLEREVVFLQALEAEQSRHIVKLIQAGTVNNQPVLVLERMSGNLDQWLAQRRRDGAPLPDLARILDWAGQILSGLGVIHQNGFVYRDLKFSNLLVDEDGALLKLADFGSIKREDGDNTRSFIGTPATMAPEQMLPVCLGADGYEYRVDHRADYYALGLLLFTLLTEQPTTAAQRRLSQLLIRHGQEGASQYREQLGGLDDKERIQLRRAIEFWTVPLSTTPGGGTAAQLTTLIDRLLARDPTDRPNDSAEIRTVLDAAQAGQPILPMAAPSPPLPATLADRELSPPPAPPLHRHHSHRADPAARGTWSRRRTVGLVSVLSLAGAMAWAIIQQPSAPRQDQADSLPAVIAPSVPANAPVAPTPVPELSAEQPVPVAPTLAAPDAPEPAVQNPATANTAIAPIPAPAAPAPVADTPAPVADTPAPGDDDGTDTPTVVAKPPVRATPAVVETPPAPVRKAPSRKTAKATPPPVVETPAPDQGEDEDEPDTPTVVAKPLERAPTQARSAPTRKATQSQSTAKTAPPPATEPAAAPRPAPTPPSAPVVAKPTPKPAAPEPPRPTPAKATASRERLAPAQASQPRTATATRSSSHASRTSAPPAVSHHTRPRPQTAPSDLPPIELTARSQSTPSPTPSAPPEPPPIKLVSRSQPAPVTVSAPPPEPPPTASTRTASRRRNPEPPAAPPPRATNPINQFKEDAGRAAADIRHQAETVGNWLSDTGKQIQRGLDNADRTISTWAGTCSAANGCNQGSRVERRDRWTAPHGAETPSRYQRSAPDDDEGGYAAPPPRQAQY